jgi:hypothetical protein
VSHEPGDGPVVRFSPGRSALPPERLPLVVGIGVWNLAIFFPRFLLGR